jgi:hypothetical protein
VFSSLGLSVQGGNRNYGETDRSEDQTALHA